MKEEIKEETLDEVTAPQEKIQVEPKTDEKSENNNWLKYRLEREREKGAKQILTELGVTSKDEIKVLYKKLDEITQNYEKSQKIAKKAKTTEQKLEILKNGFDEKFVDFIAHELHEKVSENEDFSNILSKFKDDNPHYLKNQEKHIKFSTAPNFENKAQGPTNSYELMDNLIRKK